MLLGVCPILTNSLLRGCDQPVTVQTRQRTGSHNEELDWEKCCAQRSQVLGRGLVKAALSDYKEKATLLLLGLGKGQYSEIFSAQPQTHAAAHRQCQNQNHEGYPRMQALYVPTQVPRTYPCTTARKTRNRTHNHMHKCQTPARSRAHDQRTPEANAHVSPDLGFP